MLILTCGYSAISDMSDRSTSRDPEKGHAGGHVLGQTRAVLVLGGRGRGPAVNKLGLLIQSRDVVVRGSRLRSDGPSDCAEKEGPYAGTGPLRSFNCILAGTAVAAPLLMSISQVLRKPPPTGLLPRSLVLTALFVVVAGASAWCGHSTGRGYRGPPEQVGCRSNHS